MKSPGQRKPVRTLVGLSLLVVILLGVSIALYREELERVYRVVRLFERSEILHNFRSMDSIFETVPVRAGGPKKEFPRAPEAIPSSYEYQGETRSLEELFDRSWTTGLIVLHDGAVAFESYDRGNGLDTRTISWSLAKSFISALVGIAVEKGQIDSIERSVSDFVPALVGSGYEGVSIRDVLQMSSGVGFDEDYADPFSDINWMGYVIALGNPIEDFAASLERSRDPGTFHHYVSMDTQVLAMVLRRATGESVATLLENGIWKRIAMQSDAYWAVDREGVVLAFGGLNATLRDYARFGQLYLQEGLWNGEQVIARDWVRASVTSDASHLQPGDNPDSDSVLGYGFQWWIPGPLEGDYLAIGIYNQFIYVHPSYRVVIAKTSAYPDYKKDGVEMELETVQAFRAIARSFGDPGDGDRTAGR